MQRNLPPFAFPRFLVFSLFDTFVFVFSCIRCIRCCTISLSLPLLRLLVLRLLVLRLRLPPVPHHRTLSFFQSWYVGLVDPTYCTGFFGVFEEKEFYVWGSSLVLSVGSFYRRSFCSIGSSVSCVKSRVFALMWGVLFHQPSNYFFPLLLSYKERRVCNSCCIDLFAPFGYG